MKCQKDESSWDDNTGTGNIIFIQKKSGCFAKCKQNQNAMIRKSHKPIFYSQQNKENIKCWKWDGFLFNTKNEFMLNLMAATSQTETCLPLCDIPFSFNNSPHIWELKTPVAGLEYCSLLVYFCLAEICKMFPEKHVIWMGTYVALKPINIFWVLIKNKMVPLIFSMEATV